jgi:hypothetical protein
MNREDIERKIIALQRLSENAGTKEEAAAAAAQAQRLITKYKIDTAILDATLDESGPVEDIMFHEDALCLMSRKVTWKTYLALHLARANGTESVLDRYWDHNMKSRTRIRLVGKHSNVENTRIMFDFCCKEIQNLVKLRQERVRRGRLPEPEHPQAYYNSYRMGCVDAIRANIAQERINLENQMREQAGREGKLVVLDKALMALKQEGEDSKRWMNDNLKLKTEPFKPTSSREGREAGKREGADIYGNRDLYPKVKPGQLRIGEGKN